METFFIPGRLTGLRLDAFIQLFVNPKGSIQLNGLGAYAYKFNPPNSPIGSEQRIYPIVGSYCRFRSYTNKTLKL